MSAKHFTYYNAHDISLHACMCPTLDQCHKGQPVGQLCKSFFSLPLADASQADNLQVTDVIADPQGKIRFQQCTPLVEELWTRMEAT